jgi:lysine 6-dehydrogenase
MPYELEGKINTLENKTLRYLGHWDRFKAYSDLGLFEEDPIFVNGQKIIPRSLYHALLEPKINPKEIKDLGIIKIFAEGTKNKESLKTVIEVLDYFDESTGFTAMQRLTGWHASIMAYLAAQNKTNKGSVSVNNAVKGEVIIDELRKRGIRINIDFS